MLNHKKIAVVIPAYNEAKLIGQVIKTMPAFVDLIVIIDDASRDKTVLEARTAAKTYHRKTEVLTHKVNAGVGAAAVTGFTRVLELKYDIIVIVNGDAQMDPGEMKGLVLPIIEGKADFTKGNRLIYGQAWKMIPKVRYFGNSVLSLLTKITSGYWHVADSQTGYVAMSRSILEKININNLYKRYGFPNDLLIHMNVARARLMEIPIKPIYNIGEKSGIKLWKVIPAISWLLFRRFFWRLKVKYIIEDFHPLVFFYFSSFGLNFIGLLLLVRLIYITVTSNHVPSVNALALFFCIIMASQFLFFAMWFDMDYNKDLRIK